MKKTLLTTVTCLSLTACVGFGKTEIEILKAAAINDAKQAGTDLHLAFLQCYALEDYKKKDCQRAAASKHQRYVGANNWEYILPFRYEAEKLGFKAYLNDHGKPCKTINDGPVFDAKQKAYIARCTGGENYAMRFDYREGIWVLEDK